jgi:hypothetical protein
LVGFGGSLRGKSEIVEKVFHWFEETIKSRSPRLWKPAIRKLALLGQGFHLKFGMQNAAFTCATQRRAAPLTDENPRPA